MLKNHLKIAWRNLRRNKFYSTINIMGMAVAITCLLLAVMYWNEEHSFDDFHTNNPNLYRINTNLVEYKGAIAKTVGTTGQVQGQAFKEAVPEIQNYARIMGGKIFSEVSTDEKTLLLNTLFVDTSFFEVFTFPLLHGTVHTALKDVNGAVLSESTAMRLFNSTDVVGRVLRMESDPSYQRLKKPLVVSAVAKDPPKNSSIQFDILLPFDFLELAFVDTNWLNTYLGTFVVLKSSSEPEVIEQKFNRVFAIHAKDQVEQSVAQYGFDSKINYGLQNILDIHLEPLLSDNDFNGESGIVDTSTPIYSLAFLLISLLILVLAVINFINITMAVAMNKTKEIGIRKISGSSKSQIIFQYLIESGLLCSISLLLSLLVVKQLFPIFNSLTAKHFVFEQFLQLEMAGYLLLIFGLVTLFTGLYPAFVLSNFQPSEVLSNKLKWSGQKRVGSGLLVFQFSLGIFLLMTAIIFHSQMDYIRTKDLGYNPEQIITTAISGNRNYDAIGKAFKETLSREPAIVSVSYAHNYFSGEVMANNKRIESSFKRVDENYFPSVEIPVLSGRNFSTDFVTDLTNSVIVNETFVNTSNFSDPVGKSIELIEYEGKPTKTITGVVKDFHFGSLREPIKPMVISMEQIPYGNILIKFQKSKQQEAISAVEKVYKSMMPNAVFTYDFLNELNAKQYKQELQWQKLISIATVLAIIICCIGLLGITHLSMNQRIKEIGIRKVLGASVTSIVALLSKDFIRLVLIAIFIATPIAWYAMNRWLQGFAYRIELRWWMFAGAGLIAVVVSLMTVSGQSIRAATADPVKSLKTE